MLDDVGILKPLIKLLAYMLPYALIPLTFKFAGGIFATFTGMVGDKSKGFFDRAKAKRAAKWERGPGRQILQSRASWQNSLQNASSRGGRLRGLALRGAARGIGGHNIQAQDSARRAAVAKESNDQIATGRDDERRGLTVNKFLADQSDAARQIGTNADGSAMWDRDIGHRSVLRRVRADGTREYKSLGGGWVSEGAVLEGHRKWDNDTYTQQASLSYEMRKASTSEEVAGIGERYNSLATESRGHGGWGQSRSQAVGTLRGAGFENANKSLEFKHMRTDGTVDYAAFAQEMYENKGSYPLAQMSAHTIEQLEHAYDSGSPETQQQVQSILETFMYRGGAMGSGADDEAVRATAGTQVPGSPGSHLQTNTPGAAHVAEEVRRVAQHVGIYQPVPPGGRSPGPPPNIPPQN